MTIKVKNLIKIVDSFVLTHNYRFTVHAQDRMLQREISRAEVRYVLLNGRHEENKDSLDLDKKQWKYSIRGKTVDRRNLRIIVIIENNLVIVTTIDLTRKNGGQNENQNR